MRRISASPEPKEKSMKATDVFFSKDVQVIQVIQVAVHV